MFPMTALRDLYDTVTAANGWSLRDVERRAADRGYALSKSRIGQLVNADPLDSVTGSSILGLAAGLGISPARVAQAAVQSMGIMLSPVEITPAEAIARDETLSEDTRRALLAILQAPRRGVRGA